MFSFSLFRFTAVQLFTNRRSALFLSSTEKRADTKRRPQQKKSTLLTRNNNVTCLSETLCVLRHISKLSTSSEKQTNTCTDPTNSVRATLPSHRNSCKQPVPSLTPPFQKKEKRDPDFHCRHTSPTPMSSSSSSSSLSHARRCLAKSRGCGVGTLGNEPLCASDGRASDVSSKRTALSADMGERFCCCCGSVDGDDNGTVAARVSVVAGHKSNGSG